MYRMWISEKEFTHLIFKDFTEPKRKKKGYYPQVFHNLWIMLC